MLGSIGTRVLPVLISLCLGALAMAQLDTSGVMAASGRRGTDVAPSAASGAPAMQAGPTSLQPLRWRIPWAVNIGTGHPEVLHKCLTQVSVTVPFEVKSVVVVNVEFFNTMAGNFGESVKTYGANLNNPPTELGAKGTVQTDNPFLTPFNAYDLNTGDFQGYALVNASDPRVFVSAHLICYDADSLAISSIPAYPVGATLDYYQAGMPMTGMPPTAVPQSPQ